jgi:hypothetical protein
MCSENAYTATRKWKRMRFLGGPEGLLSGHFWRFSLPLASLLSPLLPFLT